MLSAAIPSSTSWFTASSSSSSKRFCSTAASSFESRWCVVATYS